MDLERVVIVNETRFRPDEWGMPGFDLRHIEGPLKCSGLADNVDNFYFGDYANPDEALMNYCLEKKPQVVLLSLQSKREEIRPPTPTTLKEITYKFDISTVMFWFDIHSDLIVAGLEGYLPSVTLNVILGADPSSHKPLPLQGIDYVYAGDYFDERLFDIPEGNRDIPVGFLGSLYVDRLRWIERLREFGIPIYTDGGFLVDGKRSFLSADRVTPIWMPYERYLELISRLRIALDFSLLTDREYGFRVSYREQLRKVVRRPHSAMKYIIPTLKHSISALRNPAREAKYTRYQVRARVWEALWCRTFLLEEDNPVTSLYFEPYVDYVPFTTLKDLVEKIRYYLEKEEERDRIRLQGRATVEKYYNARVFCENLFEVIGLLPARQEHRPGEIWNKAYFDRWYLSKPSIQR